MGESSVISRCALRAHVVHVVHRGSQLGWRLGWQHGRMDSVVFQVEVGDRLVTDLTERVARFAEDRGDGLVSVFAPHATAGLALMELGSGSEDDLADTLARLLPRHDRYRHRHGSAGHGADHLLPVLVSPSLVLPVIAGQVALGTWQRVVLVDSNGDNLVRSVRCSFVGD